MSEKNRPVAKLWDGRLSASIWQQEGENGRFYNVTVERLYTDKDDATKSSSSFSGTEPLQVANLMAKAYDRMVELRKVSKGATEPENVTVEASTSQA